MGDWGHRVQHQVQISLFLSADCYCRTWDITNNIIVFGSNITVFARSIHQKMCLAAITLCSDHAPLLRPEIFGIVEKCSGDQEPSEDVWIFAQSPKLWKLETCDVTDIIADFSHVTLQIAHFASVLQSRGHESSINCTKSSGNGSMLHFSVIF